MRRVGDTLTIGAIDLRGDARADLAPGSGLAVSSDLAPSLLMNDADLAATQLIQPGSRVRYAALFAGDRSEAAQFAAVARDATSCPRNACATSREASPEIGNASSRAARFLRWRASQACCCVPWRLR